ncbi:hypothetical protein QJS66_13455 [Kocuria rhizophila]|nr:hypothetical protein QJS66_13455 [Kocuria rhizophila]
MVASGSRTSARGARPRASRGTPTSRPTGWWPGPPWHWALWGCRPWRSRGPGVRVGVIPAVHRNTHVHDDRPSFRVRPRERVVVDRAVPPSSAWRAVVSPPRIRRQLRMATATLRANWRTERPSVRIRARLTSRCPPVTHRSAARTTFRRAPGRRRRTVARAPVPRRCRPAGARTRAAGGRGDSERRRPRRRMRECRPDRGLPRLAHGVARRAGAVAASAACFTAIVVALASTPWTPAGWTPPCSCWPGWGRWIAFLWFRAVAAGGVLPDPAHGGGERGTALLRPDLVVGHPDPLPRGVYALVWMLWNRGYSGQRAAAGPGFFRERRPGTVPAVRAGRAVARHGVGVVGAAGVPVRDPEIHHPAAGHPPRA